VRIRNILLATYTVVCAAALTQPGYVLFANRVEPFVLGLPLVLVWSVGWIMLTFVVLALYHLTDRRG
jgi:hypothetical protein